MREREIKIFDVSKFLKELEELKKKVKLLKNGSLSEEQYDTLERESIMLSKQYFSHKEAFSGNEQQAISSQFIALEKFLSPIEGDN